MTFREFLASLRMRQTLVGDFIADATRDPLFQEVKFWNQLHLYLLARGACEGAIMAGRRAWRRYEKLAA